MQTVITLADKLNLRLVAEGIETEEQLQSLQAMGCTRGQGYFFARPMNAAAASDYLNENLGEINSWCLQRRLVEGGEDHYRKHLVYLL